jgi:hypothetical protein
MKNKDNYIIAFLLSCVLANLILLGWMGCNSRGHRSTRCVSSPACICREPDVLCWDQVR